MLPTPVDDSQGGVDLLFSSPVQSPARLLRELHADPDIQAQLEAERERDRAFERVRLAARGGSTGVLSLLSSNARLNACVLSVARLIAALTGVLMVTVPTLLLLLESDLDVSFLHEIRQTPEFEQFHFEYYCPLRRWIVCKISMAMENLWSD
uniref:FERM domain containing 3 n=2 Tax=Hippocampus comes TaxID=109280 RepID=A0A3Q3DCR8_HIPCM